MAATLLATAVQMALPLILKRMLDPNVPVADAQARQVASAAAEAVAPLIVSKANAEPWYQSRVTWGALVSIGTGLATLAGFAVAPEDAELIIGIGMASGTLVGGAITLWGRWKAKKPIGQ